MNKAWLGESTDTSDVEDSSTPQVPHNAETAEVEEDGSIALPSRSRWHLSRWVLALALILVGAFFLFLYPYPMVINYPGPTFNVLGKDEGNIPLIEVKGAKTYPENQGELRMTTVSSLGGPSSMVSGWDLIWAAFSPYDAVLPEEKVYPRNITSKQIKTIGVQQMDQSQLWAEAVALESLGYPVKVTWSVAGIEKGSPAQGVLQEQDIIETVALPGQEKVTIHAIDDLRDFLRRVAAGSTIELGIVRDGEPQTITMKTAPALDSNGKPDQGSQLSVYLASDVDIPLDIQFHLQDVGGPSAGTMFALGIVEQLTPEELTGDKVIAGTGTIDLSGKVGPISGIVQKMAGARADGAQYFLAPGLNCAETVGHVPEGLTVTRINTFDEALQAVKNIRDGKTADLPKCTASTSR